MSSCGKVFLGNRVASLRTEGAVVAAPLGAEHRSRADRMVAVRPCGQYLFRIMEDSHSFCARLLQVLK